MDRKASVAPFVDGVIPTTMDKKLAPEGTHVFSMFTQWVPDDWVNEPHRDELDAYAKRIFDLLQRPRAELQGRDHRLPGDRSVRHGAGARADRRQHLPRRALGGSAVPHAAGAGLRGLPHADQGPVPRLLGHPRRRRGQRHPRLEGVPCGREGQGDSRSARDRSRTDAAPADAGGALGRGRGRLREGGVARAADAARAGARRVRRRRLPGEPRLRRGARAPVLPVARRRARAGRPRDRRGREPADRAGGAGRGGVGRGQRRDVLLAVRGGAAGARDAAARGPGGGDRPRARDGALRWQRDGLRARRHEPAGHRVPHAGRPRVRVR